MSVCAIDACARGRRRCSAVRRDRNDAANGLRVIVVPTGFPNLVSIQIPVQTGSRNEVEPGKSGFAHFFEHLMFRGTPNTPPEKYREIVSKAGARENANTGDDRTIYHATFAKEDLEQILELDADRFQHLAYSEADFKTEARAVLGEYNKNAADPLREAPRSAARRASTSAHLQAHHDGLHQRHRGHAEPVRRTRRCSSSAGTGRSTPRSSSPAT